MRPQISSEEDKKGRTLLLLQECSSSALAQRTSPPSSASLDYRSPPSLAFPYYLLCQLLLQRVLLLPWAVEEGLWAHEREEVPNGESPQLQERGRKLKKVGK